MLPEITLSRKNNLELQRLFPNVSRQTIHASLKYFNNSDTAKKIRQKAIELMENELKAAKKIETT